MSIYKVENKMENYEQYIVGSKPHDTNYCNWVGDYIEAENEEIAIEKAIDYLRNEYEMLGFYTKDLPCNEIGFQTDTEFEKRNIYYYDFIATKVR